MSFGASFGQGYQVGESMRKRRATSKFFEKFKELSADDEEEMVAEDGSAIPLDTPAGDEVRAAIPAAAADKGAPAAEGKTVLPLDAAPADPVVTQMPAAPAIPADDMPAAPAAEAALPLAAEPKKGTKEAKKSLKQDDIKELDRLAMDAARASGDVAVYTALQQTTNSFLQGKVLSNMGLAQTAARNGDVDATEKYLKKAYRFVPDGQEINFERREGKLYVQDPWSDKGEEVELGAEQIGYLSTMIRDPEKWSEMVRAEKKDRATAALEERKVTATEQSVKVDQARVDVMREQLGISREELALKGRETTLRELMGPIERMSQFNQGMYYKALAEYTKAGKGAGVGLDASLDDSREMAKEVDDQFLKYAEPGKDMAGNVDPNWKPPKDIAGMEPKDILAANGLAQSIGVINAGRVSPAMAVQAGLALARSRMVGPDGQPMGKVMVDPENGMMTFDYAGQTVPIKLPKSVVDGLVMEDNQRAAGAAQGLPQAIPVNPNPTGQPARAW
jgi:hypothetical protein